MKKIDKYTVPGGGKNKSVSPYVAPGIVARVPTFSVALGEYILKSLAEHYAVTVEQLKGRRGKIEVSYTRHLFCYWMADTFIQNIGYRTIGEFIGDRDHTTVIHSKNTYQDWLDIDLIFDKPLPTGHTSVREDYLETLKYIQLCLSEFQER